MAKSIFIEVPWSGKVAYDMYVSGDQVKEIYDIIIKAFLYKYEFEKAGLNGSYLNVKQFDLSDVKIFNGFVNDAVDNILDPVAREYVLETIRQIRDNNFNKKTVQATYETLYKVFEPDSLRIKNIRTMLADAVQIIDFGTIFKKCNRNAFTKDSPEIKEILNTYNVMIEMHMKETKLI